MSTRIHKNANALHGLASAFLDTAHKHYTHSYTANMTRAGEEIEAPSDQEHHPVLSEVIATIMLLLLLATRTIIMAINAPAGREAY